MAIRFFAVSALTTGPAGVAWVYQFDLDTGPRGLVTDKASELGESPGMPLVSVCTSNRCPLSDSGQVFQSDCLACASGLVDQGFCYPMVGILLKAFLSSAPVLEAAFRGAGTDLLQRLAAFLIAQTNFIDFRTTEGFTFAIRCQNDHAEVYSDGLGCFSHERGIFVLSNVQVVNVTSPHEISTANCPFRVYQHGVLALAQYHRADNAPCNGQERDLIKRFQTVGTGIITDTSTRTKLGAGITFSGPGCSKGFDGFRTRIDSQLRRHRKASARLSIHAVVGCIGVGDVFFPTERSNPRSRCIETQKRFLQDGFVPIYVKLDADGSYDTFLHKESVAESRTEVKKGGKQGDCVAIPTLS